MRESGSKIFQVLLFAAIMALAGCASHQDYTKAFDNDHSLTCEIN
jgi:uncharacterized lipoprotein